MEPSPLADHYTRYKLGTAKIIRWLSQQAQRITERSGNVMNLPSPLTTKTLIRLAKIISLAKPKSKVPISILLVIEDVIRGRQRCADFYGQLEVNTTDGKFTSTNESHRHFISVLEEVRTLLKALDIEQPKNSGHSTGSNSKSTGSKPAESVKKNIFETLELEEPSDRLQNLSVTSKKGGKKSEQPPSTPELEEDGESKAAMSVWCMFEDIREIRNHLQSVWRDFYDGKISFLAAVELTQTAFIFMEHITWGLEPIDNGPEISYDEISDFLGIETTMGRRGTVTLFMNKTNIRATSDAAELLCISAWTVLQDFRTCIMAVHNPKYSNVRYNRQPFADALRQCEPILRHMATVLGDEPYNGDVKGFWLDSFTDDLLQMCRGGGPIPIRTVAQCQVIVDALPALAGQIHLGDEIVRESLDRSSYETRYKGYERMAERLGDQHAREIFAAGRQNGTIPGMDAALYQGLVGTYPWPSDRNPEDLLKHLPLFAGFRLCHVRVGHCISSINSSEGESGEVDHAAVLGLAYLYRAARRIDLLQGEWADMETLIASQNMAGLYVREADSLAGYARHFDLSIGVPASAFARNAALRPGLPGKSTIATKLKRLQSPSAFARRLAHGADLVASGLNGYSAFYASLYKDAETMKKAPVTHLTSVELLQTIQQSMEADEVYLKFDYWAFSMRCKAIFDNLRKREAGQLKKLFGKKIPDVVELTHTILWQAADTPLNSRPRERPLLAGIAEHVGNVSVHDGCSFLSVAQHGTTGHIKEEDKPSSKYKWGGEQQVNPYGTKQDRPETHREVLEEVVDAERNRILNATCAKFRELENAGITTEKRLALTRAWADEEFVKAKLPFLINKMDFLEEFQNIVITTKVTGDPVFALLAEIMGDPFWLLGGNGPEPSARSGAEE
ncbi:hypothetical protein CB0940_07389 [Cercospora beticola]|uniref:DUF6604 domain-containing protein n=1 Tax=Cercospora beticola TaxID=122368 RepID=A0A2G5H9Q1_CERBT|nr:hypothetical protein CB0940_07389 [Cercospora beticola]PIA89257.1 hypothetical protein CB0940_07389 [Cercospora beticola]WPB03333.1 hypothetical protein RHO25_007970 [Cercospora beticola]